MYQSTEAHSQHPRKTVRLACAILAVAASVAVLCSGPQVAKAAVAAPAFPRLAIWWPDPDRQSVADLARCDWIALQNYGAGRIAALRAANPDITILGNTDSRELNYVFGDYNHRLNVELRSASTDWILTQVGTTLTSDITAATTSIPVRDVTKFAVGEMVLVDHELMRVDAIGASSLTVMARGPVNPPAAHSAGARIASVVTVWPGTITMDLSTNCPKRDVGYGLETWAQWNIRRGCAVLSSAPWDGLLIDCLESNGSWMAAPGKNRSIDPLRSNVPVTDGYAAFDTAWNNGAVAYGSGLRTASGGKILIGNGNMRNFQMNGNIFEEFPYASLSPAIWNLVFAGPFSAPHASYAEWCANSSGPNLTMIQTYGSATNYHLMRFGLTSALMNDGYFSYALSSSYHATAGLYWFDEYDNAGAGRGYLGQPTGAMKAVGSAWRRDFTGGIVLVNPTASAVTVQLGGTFRKIDGRQDRSVNDGTAATSVTIPARDGIILLSPAPAPVLPSGTMTVAAGAAQVTSADVAITSAVTAAAEMRVDPGSGTFGAWVAYAPTKQISLAGGNGANLVRAEFRNAAGTVQLIATVDLQVPAPPTDPPVTPPDPPVVPTDPPITPTDPPVTPTDPPVTPTDPPVVPVDPPVDPTATVTAAATLRSSITTLSYGKSTTLRNTLSPASEMTVRVEKRTSSNPEWVQVAVRTTGTGGTASLSVTPLVTTEYRAVIVDTGVVSKAITVVVRARATVTSSRRTVARRRSLTVSGKVTTGVASLATAAAVLGVGSATATSPEVVTAVLQRKIRSRWVTIKRVTVGVSGRYHVHIRPRARGTYRYRVRVSTSGVNAVGVSRTIRIRVR